jgi:hypothetical protein
MEAQKYDYMKRAMDMFDIIGDDPSIAALLKAKDIITEISHYVQKLGMFLDHKDKYDEYIALLNKGEDKEARLEDAFGQFIYKMAEAPTRMHARGVVIFNIPAM